MVGEDQAFLSKFLYCLKKLLEAPRLIQIRRLATMSAIGLSQARPAKAILAGSQINQHKLAVLIEAL